MNKKHILTIIFIGLMIITACNIPSKPVELATSTIAPPTPLIPATATITFTPAPTASPTLTPVPFFFTEEFNSDLSAWTFFQTNGETDPTVAFENDMLRLDILSPHTWYYAIHNSHEYKNVSISAKFTGTPSGSMGLICHYSETGWYEFNLASDGTYSLLLAERLSDEIAQYIPIATSSTNHLQAGSLNYEIGLTCQENTLFLYINQTLLRKLDITNYGLTEGKVGVSASSFDEIPMTASFDWIKVSEPSQ